MNAKELNILLIEDNPDDARLIREMLAETGPARFVLACADRLSTELERLRPRGRRVWKRALQYPTTRGTARDM